MASKFTKAFFVLSSLLVMVDRSKCCSRPTDYEPLSVAERTRQAPIVVEANVSNEGQHEEGSGFYNATLSVITVFKGSVNFSQILVRGFGPGATCATDISHIPNGSHYIFFLDVDPYRVVEKFDENGATSTGSSPRVVIQKVNEGLCCPRTQDCKVDDFTCSGSGTIFPTKSVSILILLVVSLQLMSEK